MYRSSIRYRARLERWQKIYFCTSEKFTYAPRSKKTLAFFVTIVCILEYALKRYRTLFSVTFFRQNLTIFSFYAIHTCVLDRSNTRRKNWPVRYLRVVVPSNRLKPTVLVRFTYIIKSVSILRLIFTQRFYTHKNIHVFFSLSLRHTYITIFAS